MRWGVGGCYWLILRNCALFPNSFVAGTAWTPVGTLVGLSALEIMLLPLAVSAVIAAFSHNREAEVIVNVIIALVMLGGLAAALINLVPNLASAFLPMSAAWAIALEEFKTPLYALLGVGSGNYLNAFTVGRPVGLNLGPLWNIRFVTGPSFLFEMLTALGVFGLAAFLLLLRSVLSALKAHSDWGLKVSLVLAALLLMLVPPSLTFFLTALSLLLLAESTEKKYPSRHLPSRNISLAVGAVFAVAALASLYPLGRFYGGELAYYRSLLAMQKNNGTDTYNLEIRAITFNPNISTYHLGLSQTSLALSSAIVTQAGSGTSSATLSVQDRQLATQLISQAITEAKTATFLAPRSVVTWQNLAGVYESIAKVAQNADQWTIAAYQQAIQLDPSNPVLRLRLGSVYLSLNRLDEAAGQFLLAAQLKPDYANAHYNLAYVYRQEQKYLQAAAELTVTKNLVKAGSDDEQKVITELSEVKSHLTKAESSQLDQLNTPNTENSLSGNAAEILSPIVPSPSPLAPGFNQPSFSSPSAR